MSDSLWPMDCSPRDWTRVSGIAGRFFTVWATRWLWNSFYLFMYLNWRIITNCDGFCHKSTWIDHRHTRVPSILSPPPTPLPPHPIPPGCHTALALGALLHTSNSHWLFILHMAIYMSQLFSQIISSSPSPPEPKSLFFMSVAPLLSCM